METYESLPGLESIDSKEYLIRTVEDGEIYMFPLSLFERHLTKARRAKTCKC